MNNKGMKILLAKLFPWLSIRSKLLIAFVGLSVVPVALIGISGVLTETKMMERNAIDNLTHDVQTIRERTAHFLSDVESDLRVLANSSLLLRFKRELDKPVQNRTRQGLFEQVSAEFLAFVQTKDVYYRIRMVGADGDELFRIEVDRRMDSIRRYRIIQTSELRQSNETYYFRLVKKLRPDQIAVAPAELVDEEGRLIPVISFAMPVGVAKGSVGILIADVFAKDLFRIMEEKRHAEVDGKVILATSDGRYLYHSEKKRDWNKLLASREEANLWHDYSSQVVPIFLSGTEGTLEQGLDEIVSYAPLFPDPPAAHNADFTEGSIAQIFVLESVSKELILGPVRSHAMTFGGSLLLVLGGAIALGLLATRQFTKPIGELQRGAEIIAKGSYEHRLRVNTGDEIEKLAQQFNTMAASLMEHERVIQRHRATLEEMVQQRTHELSEEKTKLKTIIDHVPSAFVLLDKDLRIQTASAAFSLVTDRELEDVRGLDCRSVLCVGGFCQHCLCEQVLAHGKTVDHIDEKEGSNGQKRFIEHIAVPMKTDGEVTSVLEIITDVTERKRLEQNLLRTEKLSAAGEMSAIIAHEFRNSLTSIKMILQLQKEAKKLNRSDRKSLAVALNSIDHMEHIVRELLDFARPKPMEYTTTSLNVLVDESLTFVETHARKTRVTVKKKLDANLPPAHVDGVHFKEGLVNIFLNAVQAMDDGVPSKRPREMRIVTRKVRLRRALHQFSADGDTQTEEPARSGKEIILERGRECALVEISDTGRGIEREYLQRVFDPFFTTKTNGTGLGLAMVKRTVNAHGGIVLVESKAGRGTKFSIYLPFSSEIPA